MSHEKIQAGNKIIKKVTYIGVFVNIALGILKVIVGVIVNSMALIADGTHSLSDLASDMAVIIGVSLGSKQADEKHPYGHGRMETFTAFIISIGLVIIGSIMIYYAGMQIASGNISNPSLAAIFIASLSVLLKEFLYRITKIAALTQNSSMLYANAWHHRTDALSSLAVIIGIAAAFMGFKYGDQLAAVAVGVMIIAVGAGIIADSLREISEASVDAKTIEHIKEIISATDGVAQWHNLRTRTVGREVFIDLHILVDPDLNIRQAHEISEALEKKMHEDITRPVNITVHIEPDIDILRK